MHIDLKCAVCGGNNFRIDEAENDLSAIDCYDCGHEVGTWGQIKVRILDVMTGRGRLDPDSAV